MLPNIDAMNCENKDSTELRITGLRLFANVGAITRLTVIARLDTASGAGFPAVAGTSAPEAAPADRDITGDSVECRARFAAWVEHHETYPGSSENMPPILRHRRWSAARDSRLPSATVRAPVFL
ncbi:hypothetical protein [Nocardia sp. NPDC051463]|uniref:hypothetical protein n=1 Tax=Nocardia sp. NPDC051463 TaxID=3154845 RepID=UPI00342645B5